jgi:CheY-like chemotaxis protein
MVLGEHLGWNRPLHRRRGAQIRLDGVDVFCEFDWLDVFADNRTQFTHGQRLARHVRRDCPEGKRPALLLTIREDENERAFETPEYYVVVVNVRRYVAHAEADAAASYFADRLGRGITRVTRESQIADAKPEDIRAFLELHIDGESLATWASGNASRVELMRDIASQEPTGGVRETSVADAVNALKSLDALDPEVLAVVTDLVGRCADRDSRMEILKSLTKDSPGRTDTGEILGVRAIERLRDARRSAAGYEDLLRDPASKETDLQKYIEKKENLWLLGLEYTRMRPRRAVPRGTLDFILERFDGLHDLLELKDPHDPIIKAPESGEMPPPANKYELSKGLANALAQVHVYRGTLNAGGTTVENEFGLAGSQHPRVIIVIGRTDLLSADRARVLRELNLSLHRVEIVPYDSLAERAKVILDNVERYMERDASDEH